MRLATTIDFTNTYEIENISEDLTSFQFKANTHNNVEMLFGVKLATDYNVFVSTFYNLGFGPFRDDGTINDQIEIKHIDNSKLYSTILLGALTFLQSNQDKYVGIDGSDMRRAYLFYRLLQSNYDYLAQYFQLLGVKFYVRYLRGNLNSDPLMPDNEDLATQPFLIIKGDYMKYEKLYNYFIFNTIHQ